MLPPPAWGPWPSARKRCAAHYLTFVERGGTRRLIVPALCHSWQCEPCCRARAHAYIRACLSVDPAGQFTLTKPQPAVRCEKADAKQYAAAIPRIIRQLRREHPALEYFWVYEVHRKGGLHVHGLWRGAIPTYRSLRAAAVEAGLGWKVWTEKIKRPLADVAHATKYLFQQHRQRYAQVLPARRIHRSRRFLPKPIREMFAPSDTQWDLVTRGAALTREHIDQLARSPEIQTVWIAESLDGRPHLSRWERVGKELREQVSFDRDGRRT